MKIFGMGGSKQPPSRLPAGSFSVDRAGTILASTLPQNFPLADTRAISELVLSLFRSAPRYGVPLHQLRIRYESLTIIARELRGGAIVFLAPKSLNHPDQPYGK